MEKYAWQNDVFEEYIYPFHLQNLDNQHISMIALDVSLVAVSNTGKIFTWGGPGVQGQSDELILSSNFSLILLEQQGVDKVFSSGGELTAITKTGTAYINTLWGAPVTFATPYKLVALKEAQPHCISFNKSAIAICGKKLRSVYTWGAGDCGQLGHGSVVYLYFMIILQDKSTTSN